MSPEENRPQKKGRKAPSLVFRWDEIPPGTCRLMRFGDKLVAVCKDESGDKVRVYEVIKGDVEEKAIDP